MKPSTELQLPLLLLSVLLGVGASARVSANSASRLGKRTVDDAILNNPWVVSVQWVSDERWIPGCSGALIRPQWILTSSLCILEQNLDYRVVVGRAHLNESDGEELKIGEVFPYGPLHPREEAFDLVLIRLRKPLSATSKIAPIRLGTSNHSTAGADCRTVRWSNRNDLEAIPMKHMEDQDECYELTGKARDYRTRLVCASSAGKFLESFGAPLVCVYNGENIMVGVQTYKLGCELCYMYTLVEPFTAWIEETIKANPGSES